MHEEAEALIKYKTTPMLMSRKFYLNSMGFYLANGKKMLALDNSAKRILRGEDEIIKGRIFESDAREKGAVR